MNDAKPRLVMVGNGMVGHRFLETLVSDSPNFAITAFSEEPRGDYNLDGDNTSDDARTFTIVDCDTVSIP